MACRTIHIDGSDFSGLAATSTYDIVDNEGNYLFTNKTVAELTDGLTFSINNEAYVFTFTNYRQTANWSACNPEPNSNPLAPNTVLLLHFENSWVDSSTYSHGFTANNGATTSNTQAKFGVQSFSMSNEAGSAAGTFGVRKIISARDSEVWDFGTSSFTLEGWFRNAPGGQQQTPAFGQIVNSNTGWFFGGGTSSILFGSQNAGAWDLLSLTSITNGVGDNTWYHLALVRQWYATGSTWLGFFNGVPYGINVSAGSLNSTLTNFNGPFVVGSNLQMFGNDWDGWMDEIRISNVARWTGSFSVPTSPYGG